MPGDSYDVFLSYSHARDKPLARAIQVALGKLAKPWYVRRTLRVFRDDASLTANASLWAAIESSLHESRFLVLLASPEAASSPWIEREIRYWVDSKPRERVLIALADGVIQWDDAAGDFDWTATNCLPPALRGCFAHEPLYVDFRFARDDTLDQGLNLAHARFRNAVATLAAAVHGKPKDALEGEDLRVQRRNLTWAYSAVATLLLMLLVAGAEWRQAVVQRTEAQAQQFASRSQLAQLTGAPALSYDLADSAWRTRQNLITQRAVFGFSERAARAALPHPDVTVARFTPDGGGVLTVSLGVSAIYRTDYHIAFWSTRGEQLWTYDILPDVLAFSPDGKRILLGFRRGPARPPGRDSAATVARIPGRLEDDPWNLGEWQAVLLESNGRTAAVLTSPIRLTRVGFATDISHLEVQTEDANSWAWYPDSGKVIPVEPRPAARPASHFADTATGGATLAPSRGYTDVRRALAGCIEAPLSVLRAPSPRDVDESPSQTAKQVDARVRELHGTEISDKSGEWCMSPDASLVAAVGENTVYLWDLRTETVARLSQPPFIQSVAFRPGGREVITGAFDGSIILWDSTGHASRRITSTSPVTATTWLQGGLGFVTGHEDGSVVVHRVDGVVDTLRHGSAVTSVASSLQGDLLTTSTDGVARFWEHNGVMRWQRRADVALNAGAVSRNGHYVTVGSTDGKVSVIDAATGSEVGDLQVSGSVQRLQFDVTSPARLLVVSADTVAVLYDWKGKRTVGVFVHRGIVRAASFCPDGDHVLTAGGDGTAALWTRTGARQAVFPHVQWIGQQRPYSAGYNDILVEAAFMSADHLRVVTIASDETLRIWDREGVQLALRQLEGPARLARLSDDRSRILVVFDSAAVLLPFIAPDDIIQRNRAMVRPPAPR